MCVSYQTLTPTNLTQGNSMMPRSNRAEWLINQMDGDGTTLGNRRLWVAILGNRRLWNGLAWSTSVKWLTHSMIVTSFPLILSVHGLSLTGCLKEKWELSRRLCKHLPAAGLWAQPTAESLTVLHRLHTDTLTGTSQNRPNALGS